jgi:hypothetical protein
MGKEKNGNGRMWVVLVERHLEKRGLGEMDFPFDPD